MKGQRPPIAVLTSFPPAPRPLPQTLRLAPELAVLALLNDALCTAIVALLAQHPALEDLGAPGEPPTLRRARRLAAAACDLRSALDHYRHAVAGELNLRVTPREEDAIF